MLAASFVGFGMLRASVQVLLTPSLLPPPTDRPTACPRARTHRQQRQLAVLSQWEALGPRLRASEMFRRHEAGGRVGVLMSVVDEGDINGIEGMKVVQASNAAYDRLLAKPLQSLKKSIHKRCLLAFLVGS